MGWPRLLLPIDVVEVDVLFREARKNEDGWIEYGQK
jgi:hypothetical protein